MTEEIVPLDGNAAAGDLEQLFSFDVTSATVICRECSLEGPMGELHLYGRDIGLVLRCRRCQAVNVRMMETPRSVELDLSGLSRLSVRKS